MARLDLPDAEICDRYRGGATIMSLAAAYQVNRGVIRRRLTEGGVTPRPLSEALRLRRPLPRPARDNVDEPGVVSMYRAGASIQDTAAEHGVCYSIVREVLTDRQEPIRHARCPRANRTTGRVTPESGD
jgi:hypothetical protein